ncbi:MAG TPA: AtpZ/AtpI family protein [Desulfosalsimonadaceae bacterium]|nr:AtpZ/AtpI family protein [Desulfosalsimonadaceae bacterium]
MKKETRQMVRELGWYSALGFSVALSVFIGLFIGLFLDKVFGTTPWLMFVFLVFGIIAGFNNILLAIKKVNRNSE